MNLKIEDSVLKEICLHLTESYPNEGCGFLYGTDGGERQILFSAKTSNSKSGDQKRRFEISPEDYMHAEKFAIEKNFSLLGIYHSHPDHPALPSEHDLSVAFPFFSYIIISVLKGKTGEITSWRLNENSKKFEKEIIL